MNPMQALRAWWDGPVDPPRQAVSGLHLIFVYGTLKRGHGNHYLLETSHFVGTGWTELPLFLAEAGIPFAFPLPESPHNTRPVAGELYAVDAATRRRLDRLEGHPYSYRRTLITVLVGGERYAAEIYIYQNPSGHRESTPINKDGCYEWKGNR